MLFYNIPNHCYVVVEVKIRDFEPGDMGQLVTYIGAVDGILKGEGNYKRLGCSYAGQRITFLPSMP